MMPWTRKVQHDYVLGRQYPQPTTTLNIRSYSINLRLLCHRMPPPDGNMTSKLLTS